MNSNIQIFEKRLKIKFKNVFLLVAALTHKIANQEMNNVTSKLTHRGSFGDAIT